MDILIKYFICVVNTGVDTVIDQTLSIGASSCVHSSGSRTTIISIDSPSEEIDLLLRLTYGNYLYVK